MNRHLYALKCLDLLVDLFGPLNSDNWLLTTCLDNLYLRPGEKKEKRQGQSWFFSHFYNIFIWHKNEITKVLVLSFFIDPKMLIKGTSSNLDRSSHCFLVGWCFCQTYKSHIHFLMTINDLIVNPQVAWSSHTLNFNLGMGDVAQQVHILNPHLI